MNKNPSICLKDVTIEIPIFNAEYFSLRSSLTKKIKKAIYIKALDGISLDIKNGETVGLYGPNGSGKTTLLRTIAGGYPPTNGTVKTKGLMNNLIETWIGIYFESSGYDNIDTKLRFLGCDKDFIKNAKQEIIDFADIGDAIYNPVRTYSTGMVMRLTFSIATSIPADILLMDEWLSVGDINFQEESRERMKEIVKYAGILVIASHNHDMLNNLCDRIIYLNSGKIESELNLKK